MRPTFTILIANTGRPSLVRTLRSISGQLLPGDEVLCVVGPPHDDARRMFQESQLPGRFISLTSRGGDWGHSERNATMHLVRTSHIHHIDDDDEYAPGAIDIIRRAVSIEYYRPHIFRFKSGGQIWPDESRNNSDLVSVGNVGTPCIVHPANMRKKFKPFRGGDGHFIVDTCSLCPQGPVVHKDIIVLCRGETINPDNKS